MEIIFIDTNIFLHFENFEQIDWLKLSNSDSCKLIISPIVIDELDKHKISNSKVGKKARKTLNRIEEIIESENDQIKNRVFIEILNTKPNKKIYEKFDLNFDEQDHRLFASMIQYRNESNQQNISICTDDIGPRIRAKQYGFSTLKLDDKYRLPYETSETVKKIKKLEQENSLLKNKIPELYLCFENDKELLNHSIPSNSIPQKDFIKKELHNISIGLTPMDMENIETLNNNDLITAINYQFAPTQEQIDTYNKNLNNYLNQYELYLNNLYNYNEMVACSFEVELILVNSGTVPAENIDIHIHFPDGFELIEKNEFPERPKKPKPPVKPKSKLDFSPMILPNISNYSNIGYIDNPKDIEILSNKPTIRKTNSYNVDFKREGLKHRYQKKLDTLLLIFSSRAEIKNFKIDYIVSAGNLPTSKKGKLNIIFN